MKKRYYILALLIGASLSSCSNSAEPVIENVTLTASASDYMGQNYTSARTSFIGEGFTNIECIAVNDLSSSEKSKVGNIEKISIDDNDSFSVNDKYSKASKIVITYHDLKDVEFPLNPEEVKTMPSEDLKNKLETAGFENISLSEETDLDPDEFDREFYNELTINNSSTYDKSSVFKCDANVEIVCHKVFQKYNVSVKLDFIENWFLDKYNVDVLVDDEDYVTLNHGESTEWNFTFKEGKHKLSFLKSGDKSIRNNIQFDVDSDIDMSYELTCHSDNIALEEIYIDHKYALAENQVKIDFDSSFFSSKKNTQAIEKLKELGFTNIKENPMYDIVWGITEEGTIESVNINGSTSYKYGDVFDKSTEVIVSYHMKEENDPSRISVPKESDSYFKLDPDEVSKTFKDLGFTNVEVLSEASTKENAVKDRVCRVTINGSSFSAGESFKKESTVKIYKSSVTYEKKTNTNSSSGNSNNYSSEPTTLTLSNSDELKSFIHYDKVNAESSISSFVSKHSGDNIELDMYVAFCENNGTYKTRFNYLLYALDGDEVMLGGPALYFNDVNFLNLNITNNDVDTFGSDTKCKVKARIDKYKDGMVYLKPVSITVLN